MKQSNMKSSTPILSYTCERSNLSLKLSIISRFEEENSSSCWRKSSLTHWWTMAENSKGVAMTIFKSTNIQKLSKRKYFELRDYKEYRGRSYQFTTILKPIYKEEKGREDKNWSNEFVHNVQKLTLSSTLTKDRKHSRGYIHKAARIQRSSSTALTLQRVIWLRSLSSLNFNMILNQERTQVS